MELVDHIGLPPERYASFAREMVALTTLQAVVRWAFSLVPPSDVTDVVIQDEYSHDVLIPWTSGLYLAFDTT